MASLSTEVPVGGMPGRPYRGQAWQSMRSQVAHAGISCLAFCEARQNLAAKISRSFDGGLDRNGAGSVEASIALERPSPSLAAVGGGIDQPAE